MNLINKSISLTISILTEKKNNCKRVDSTKMSTITNWHGNLYFFSCRSLEYLMTNNILYCISRIWVKYLKNKRFQTCSLGKQISNPPLVSAEWPWRSWNMLPHAFATAAIFAITGKLWITKETSFFWCLAKFCACPKRPKPVTSVAPCALYLCINLAAGK